MENNLEIKTLRGGVELCEIADKRFKKQRQTAAFIFPLRRDTLTASALIPYLMGRGTVSCPDMSLLERKLSRLYGAVLSRTALSAQYSRAIAVTLEGPAFRLLPEKDIGAEYAAMLAEAALSPYMPDGVFERGGFDIELDKLGETIAAQYNDKRRWCARRTAELFYGDERAFPEDGFAEDLEKLTPESVSQLYRDMISGARVVLMSVGEKAGSELAGLCAERQPLPVKGFAAVPKSGFHEEIFRDGVSQDKTALYLTAGRLLDRKERAALRLGSALLGSTPTSRLFMNVREKKSLCYYCVSAADVQTGTLRIESGVAAGNARKLRDAAMAEVRDLAEGNISEKELGETLLSMKSALLGVRDSVNTLESWYLNRLLSGVEPQSPDEMLAELESVTADEIAAVFSLLELNVAGILTGKGTYLGNN